MAEPIEIKLSESIEVAGKQVDVLKFQPLTAGVITEMLNAGALRVSEKGLELERTGDAVKLAVRHCANLTPGEFDKIPGADYWRIFAAVLGFFGGFPGIGQTA
ncbi:hypothetical protein [Desulfarculus baarsii]